MGPPRITMSESRDFGRNIPKVLQKKGPGGKPHEIVYRGLNMFPDRIETTLRFNKTSFLLNAGVVFGNNRFEPTNAYDIDPIVASTAMPGFTEAGGLYRFYRVPRFKVEVHVANKETFPTVVWVCPGNFDPTANTANFQYYLSSRNSKKAYLGGNQGNNRCTLTLPWTEVSAFGGASTSGMQIDNYCGRTDGSVLPGNNMWVAFGNYGDAVGVTGVDYSIDIEVTIEFFELTTPAT